MTDIFKVIAIDGGAASGKSSTSKVLAERHNFLHVDTGAHYRGLTCEALASGVFPADTTLDSFLSSLKFETEIENRESYMKINGRRLSFEDIRSEQVNAFVSQFAAIEGVREKVKAYQLSQVEVAKAHNFNGIVMDGRDIGTVILTDADLKIFLFADETTRMKRRASEGQVDQVAQRDKLDSSRKTAPLAAAEDAVLIDNSLLSLAGVVERIESELNL